MSTEPDVFIVDGGEYDNFNWHGVYATLDAAIAANPLPEMRPIPGQQVDPTPFMERAGGWLPEDEDNWWNGFWSDFGQRIHRIKLQGARAVVVADQNTSRQSLIDSRDLVCGRTPLKQAYTASTHIDT